MKTLYKGAVLDEGLGTLDEKSLESVMSTLEKLQKMQVKAIAV